MKVFWDSIFEKEDIIWGLEPSESAIIANKYFLEKEIKDVLIPGVGYGRNARIFLENGIKITGIEISKKAIQIARKKLNLQFPIYTGSVNEMPFDDKIYEGIFCYSLIHLLGNKERKLFLKNCYNQLISGGVMFFTVISIHAEMYGKGKHLSKNRFEIENGAKVFFYDPDSIKKEFIEVGLKDYCEIDEPIKFMKDQAPLKCYLIKCIKE